MGSVLVIILQGNIFVELRTNLYLCRRWLISWGEYGTTVKEDLRELVYTPVEGSEKILDIDTDCSKPVSDSEIKSFLVDSQGIVNPLMVQSLEKSRRNEVLRTMLSLGAGIRQLSRLTGVSFGVIQKLAKWSEEPTPWSIIKNLQEKRKGIKKLSKSLEVMRKITIFASWNVRHDILVTRSSR